VYLTLGYSTLTSNRLDILPFVAIIRVFYHWQVSIYPFQYLNLDAIWALTNLRRSTVSEALANFEYESSTVI